VLNELIHNKQLFNTLIPRSSTVDSVAYIVVRLVTLECTRGVIKPLDDCSSELDHSAISREDFMTLSGVILNIASVLRTDRQTDRRTDGRADDSYNSA